MFKKCTDSVFDVILFLKNCESFFFFTENLFSMFAEKNTFIEKRGIAAALDPEAPLTNTNRYVLADITSFFTLLVGIYFPSVTGQYNRSMTIRGIIITVFFNCLHTKSLLVKQFRKLELKHQNQTLILGLRLSFQYHKTLFANHNTEFYMYHTNI